MNLSRLTAEVTSVQSKAAGKELGWGYPDYFFGQEPAVQARHLAARPRSRPRRKRRSNRQ